MPSKNDASISITPNTEYTCELYCFNEKLVNKLRESLPTADAVQKAENLFKALGGRTRLLMLYCLSQSDELCVCDIANALRMNLSTVSHQLRLLRGLGLLAYRSEGKMTFYRLADERVRGIICTELGKAPVKK